MPGDKTTLGDAAYQVAASADLKAATLAVCSPHARTLPHLAGFFPGVRLGGALQLATADALALWGGKAPVQVIRGISRVIGPRVWVLEDGPLRSVGLGKSGALPVSITVDDIGSHIEARRVSRLEALISASATADWRQRGAAARQRIVAERLWKYNTAATASPTQPPAILIVDQVAGDRSIAGAGATAANFQGMLATAVRERPCQSIRVRQHPDVSAGFRRGHFGGPLPAGVTHDQAPDSPAAIAAATEVWTVSSQFGFEALLRGVPVVTFGTPFYAGYGLTDDRAVGRVAELARSRRMSATPTLDQLVAALVLRYARYADPETGLPLDFERAMDWLLARRTAARS